MPGSCHSRGIAASCSTAEHRFCAVHATRSGTMSRTRTFPNVEPPPHNANALHASSVVTPRISVWIVFAIRPGKSRGASGLPKGVFATRGRSSAARERNHPCAAPAYIGFQASETSHPHAAATRSSGISGVGCPAGESFANSSRRTISQNSSSTPISQPMPLWRPDPRHSACPFRHSASEISPSLLVSSAAKRSDTSSGSHPSLSICTRSSSAEMVPVPSVSIV
mmetsp:Transcript_29676/g.96658  ORF Transcript_29676/g.96658 Transcript_29676/m.96658 type:complete len:224 (-) Transcript_29676:72-743(-)